ncbi:MAG: nuclear transport factor 2 family protein [Candidatus Limnocylindrales bacterium]
MSDATSHESATDPRAAVERIREAIDARDIEALVACFTPEYRNEMPLHPMRDFRGREQVRANWSRIFAAVPDIRATILRSAVVGDTVWGEWEMSGTRVDGAPHLMRGVIVNEVVDGMTASASFILEPVEQSGGTIDEAIRQQFTSAGGPAPIAPGGTR